MLIDTHCHLNFKDYDSDRAMVIGNAKKAGIKKFINPGVDLYSSKTAVELAKKHPGIVFAAIGFHPYEAQHNPEIDKFYDIYKNYKNYIVAMGECGLDYHQYKNEQARGKKDNQKSLFQAQLLFATRFNLPVVMHCRDAFEDFFEILKLSKIKGVIHCFSGGLQEVRFAQKNSLFIGIDGNITYSKHLQSIIPDIPLEMILLETDAPYLTPIPHRGTRNEPKYIPLIAKKIAELKRVSLNEVEKTTSQNAQKVFKIDL